ncbi:unnamed protein product [Rotaria sp. Silwood2]|nr:unnamed protein product [Rotaria sp. Silwood2]CAF4011626.1 unnamed protein product [Rotaria sp. Silwood2]CAF4189264.1 unnamed protein product [Rotaria sp. Silwood2]
MKNLQNCCIKLYRKQCYLFRIVNTALRDDNRTKLDKLGPNCYLIYNCIGRYCHDHGFLEMPDRSKSRSMIVYRGDSASREIIEKYRQAAGQKEKYFKWLLFVWTPADRIFAEHFSFSSKLNTIYP